MLYACFVILEIGFAVLTMTVAIRVASIDPIIIDSPVFLLRNSIMLFI